MTVSYRYTRADYVQASLLMAGRPLSRRLLDVAVYFGLMLAAAVAVLVYHGEELSVLAEAVGIITWWGWVLIFAGAAFLFAPEYFITWPIAAATFKSLSVAGSMVHVQLEDAAIGTQTENPDTQSTVAWSAIKAVKENQHGLFLALSKREALLLPRRAFAGDADYQAAAALARRRAGGEV
ncbi:MAG: YcxB family protein [Devosiaceae bacterium]|nr:YcxB family protein [Devosiaceae bacterium MH13]